jgi:hypothetical protein
MRVLQIVSFYVGTSLVLAGCANPTSDGTGFGGTGASGNPTDMTGDGGFAATGDAGGGTAPLTNVAPGPTGSSAKDAGTSPSADGGSPSPVTTPASGQSPTIGGCAIFPADNPWNTRIDDTKKFPVHARSSTYIANMSPTTHLHPDWGDWSTNHYGIPWQVVTSTTAKVPMTFDYADQSDPGPYPFPVSALVEGGAGSNSDRHVLVLDSSTCTLYETWSSTYAAPGWHCGSGAKFNLSSNALRPDGWTSADAAGLSVLAGLVKISEVQAGVVQHALRFTMSSTQQAYIHPATHAAGVADATLPPMGLRLRLKASVNVASFSGAAKVIVTAMQQYGLILADNGTDWFVSGDSDDRWSSILDPIAQAFGQLSGNDFEAVETGAIH